MPNKLSQFWQELKHRNVVRVMTVYTAASFGLLELIDIISGPLDLPNWTIKAVMILAVVGFPIAFLLSWFFPATSYGVIPKDSLYPDIELHPDELLPDQTGASGTLAKVRTRGIRAPFLGAGSLTVIAAAVLLFAGFGLFRRLSPGFADEV